MTTKYCSHCQNELSKNLTQLHANPEMTPNSTCVSSILTSTSQSGLPICSFEMIPTINSKSSAVRELTFSPLAWWIIGKFYDRFLIKSFFQITVYECEYSLSTPVFIWNIRTLTITSVIHSQLRPLMIAILKLVICRYLHSTLIYHTVFDL